MSKTQVQIPDELFRRAQQLAAQNNWSIDETIQRALESILARHGTRGRSTNNWQLPPAYHLGKPLIPEADWTTASHDN